MALPWSEGLAKRSLISPNGTLLTASLALEYGIACHLAGGTHHAHYDYAAGYCVINDLAVASLALLHHPRSRSRINHSVLIFDCDVHQGDGTARILQSEPRAFTCSIHCESNFPAEKARSDLDVELRIGTGVKRVLEELEVLVEGAVDRLAEAQRAAVLDPGELVGFAVDRGLDHAIVGGGLGAVTGDHGEERKEGKQQAGLHGDC